MRTPEPTAARAAWVARCVWRLRRINARGERVPGWERPLNWAEYLRMVEQVLAEYREEP